jgi:phage gp29-like protein
MARSIVKFSGNDLQTSPPAIAEAVRFGRRTRFNPLATLTPGSLTRALESFDRGDLREAALLWEAIANRDDTIPGVKVKREKSVAHKRLETVAVEKSRTAEKHREVLTDFWANARYVSAWDRSDAGGVKKLIRSMQAAVSYRYAMHHIVWRPSKDGLRATFEAVPLWFFECREARMRFLPMGYGYDGIELDPSEWLISYGDGLMFASSIGYYCKRATLQDWLRFSEKFAMPGVLGKTSAAQGTPEGDAMRDATLTFGNEWAAVLYGHDGSTGAAGIELIQANGNPAAMPMPALIERVDRKIAALYRGADLSTMSAGGGEGSGASLQGEETDILERADAAERSEELQRVERTVIEWHFGRGVEPLAHTSLIVPEREDQKLILEATKVFVSLGARISVREALERFGLSEAEDGEAVLLPEGQETAPTLLAENAWTDDLGPRLAEKITGILMEGLDDALEDLDLAENGYDPTWPRAPKGSLGGGRWSGKKRDIPNDLEQNINDERAHQYDVQNEGHGGSTQSLARAAADRVLRGGEGSSGEEFEARRARETEALAELRRERPELVIEPDPATYLDGGAESDVHLDGDRVLKFGRHYGFTLEADDEGKFIQRLATPSELLARIEDHNTLFGDDVRVVGLSRDGFVLSQRYFNGRHPDAEVAADFLRDSDFHPIPAELVDDFHAHLRDTTWIAKSGAMVGDVRTDNFIQTDDGIVHPIDLYVISDKKVADHGTAPNAAPISADAADGWYQIAPYGEWPTVDGKYIQVFGPEQAAAMVRHYHSIPFRLSRWLFSNEVPVFIGHPDVDRQAWPDERRLAKKHTKLEAREDGLWGQASWNALGNENLSEGYWNFPSPVWLFPKPKPGTNRVFPDVLQSVGLTNFQNTPNARRLTYNAQTTDMNIIERLKELLGLNPEDAEDAIVSAVETIIAEKAGKTEPVKETAHADAVEVEAVKAELAEEKTKREAAENALREHRTSAANAVIDAAIEAGSLTLAEKPGWQQRFATDHEAAANALAEIKPVLNKQSLDLSTAKPGIVPGTPGQRIAAVNAAVAAETERNGGNYDAAYAAVKADPKMKHIFDAMKPAAAETEI